MRRRLVCGNWKMNPSTIDEAVALARAVAAIDGAGVTVAVAPPAIALAPVARAVGGAAVEVYAQDVHWEEKGAFTGQTAAVMLRGLAQGSIVGHSEVRRDQGDDDARVAAKAAAALRAGLKVIYCVGESLEERRAGRTAAVLARQVGDGVARIPGALVATDRVAIAYEPIWAIGTGVVATGEQAAEAIATVRGELARLGHDGEWTVLYGGSVTAVNCAACAGAEGVDGALVGGASLTPKEFAEIVAAFR